MNYRIWVLMVVVVVLSGLFCSALAVERKALIEIDSPDRAMIALLHNQGLDIAAVRVGERAQLLVDQKEMRWLKERGITFRIVHEDYTGFVSQRAVREKAWSQGSLGGFHTFSEVVAFLDNLHQRAPDIVSQKFSVGTSLEGRSLWVIKISDNVNIDENEPEVFYSSLIHAREPEGMECLLYFMDYLVSNYGQDSTVTSIVNTRELYFFPVINPDGYVYNEQTSPNGGGMWRKNRRGDGSSVWGVDLNRNLGYQWGYDNSGSSNSQSAEDYRGVSAFSEPETQAYRQFVDSRQFKVALNYHTYSDVLIRPYDYADTPLSPSSDLTLYDAWGAIFTADNGFEYGDIRTTIGYSANGTQDDWCYGERVEKGKIISFTPEVGGWEDGFWPAPSRIIPLAQENLSMNLRLAEFAGVSLYLDEEREWYSDENNNGYPDGGEKVFFSVSGRNMGLESSSNVRLVFQSSSTDISISPTEIDLGQLQPLESFDTNGTPWEISLSSSLLPGNTIILTLEQFDDQLLLKSSEYELVVGPPTIYLSDSGESGLFQWSVSGGWTLTESDYYSASHSFTDSDNADYGNSVASWMSLKNPISLKGIHHPRLVFYTHWDIENGYDFAQVQLSTDYGATWTSLSGKHTTIGSGYGVQPSGEPGYDDYQANWVKEEMDLSQWAGSSAVIIRFLLISDESVTRDGWYIDDITLEGYASQASVPILSFYGMVLLLFLLSALQSFDGKLLIMS